MSDLSVKVQFLVNRVSVGSTIIYLYLKLCKGFGCNKAGAWNSVYASVAN